MYEKFGQFIDGKWQQSAGGKTYDVINPATEEVIGKASKADSSDVQKALKSAEKGLEIWRNTSPWERSKMEKRCLFIRPIRLLIFGTVSNQMWMTG